MALLSHLHKYPIHVFIGRIKSFSICWFAICLLVFSLGMASNRIFAQMILSFTISHISSSNIKLNYNFILLYPMPIEYSGDEEHRTPAQVKPSFNYDRYCLRLFNMICWQTRPTQLTLGYCFINKTIPLRQNRCQTILI